jgi:hypothetical protein
MSKKHSMTTDDGHFIRVIVGNNLVTIVEYFLDPEEGDVNIHNHVTLSYDELAWVMQHVPTVAAEVYGTITLGEERIMNEASNEQANVVVVPPVTDALARFTPVGAHTEYGDIVFGVPGFVVPPVRITMEDT